MFAQLILIVARAVLADCGGICQREALVDAIVDDLPDTSEDLASIVEDQLYKLCTAESPLVGFGDEVIDVSVLGAGVTFTHRLTEEEVSEDRLDVSVDLAVLARIAHADGGLHLPDATPLLLHRRSRHGAGRGGTPLMTWSLEGPSGWLSTWGAGSVLAVSAADGYATIEPVDPADIGDPDTLGAELHDDLHAAFDVANHGDGVPLPAERLQVAWLLQDRPTPDRHAPPFAEVVTAAGFEVDGGDIGRPGSWEHYARLGSAIGRIRRHVDHLEQKESAALGGLVEAFDAWRNDASQVPDPMVLDRLRAHPEAAMCLDEELVRADPGGLGLTDFLDAFDPERITRRGSPVHHALQSLAAELRGDVGAANTHDREALAAEPNWHPSLDRRIRFLELQGKAREALNLLQQTRTVDDHDLVTMGQRVAETSPTAGRNDPCPCGSGRKFKQCHLGKDALAPAARVSWLLDKAREHVTDFAPALLDELRSSEVGGDPENAEEEALKTALIELDMALFERGGLEGFLVARRDLLPDEEVRLTEEWIAGHRASVFRLESSEGDQLLVADQRNGDRLRVHRTPGWKEREADDLVWCRLLPDGDTWWSSGIVRSIRLQDRTAFLAASAADTEAHFHTVVSDQAERRNPPRASDGHPLVEAFTTWGVPGDRAAIEAALGTVATRSEGAFGPDETGWSVDDDRGLAAHLYLAESLPVVDPEDSARSAEAAPWNLTAHADSVARHRAVQALVAEALPDARQLLTRAAPFARTMAEEREDDLLAYLEADGDVDAPEDGWDGADDDEDEWRALLGDSDADETSFEEQMAALVASAEETWCSTAVPALHGRSPLEAVADPELLPDVRTMLRDLEYNDAAMSVDRLRTRLGLDEPPP